MKIFLVIQSLLFALIAADTNLRASVVEPSLRTSQNVSPEVDVDGFMLSKVYKHSYGVDSNKHYLERHDFEITESHRARVLAAPDGTLDFTSAKDKVISLMKLNVFAYYDDPYSESKLADVFTAGDGVWDANNYTLDNAAVTAFKKALNDTNDLKFILEPSSIAIADIGIVAVEFEHIAGGKVLVFRGTQSPNDYDNIKLWIKDWILEKMTQQIKDQWITLAGLDYTAQMISDSKAIDVEERIALRAGAWFNVQGDQQSGFATSLAAVTDLTVEEAAAQGYWPLTKLVLADVIGAGLAADKLILSGHSQGGSRAALSSMYLEKKGSGVYETITFGSVGGTCFARNLGYQDAHFLDDVNPYVLHAQITDYTDVLDIYGNMDIDVGKRCLYGTTSVASRNAKKYCEKIFGFSGPTLMVAGTAGYNQQIADDFAVCRYFTHYAPTMLIELSQNSVYLKADGTTDGGCTNHVVDEADANEQCPEGETPLLFWVGIGAAAFFGLACLCCVFCKIKSCVCGSNKTTQS